MASPGSKKGKKGRQTSPQIVAHLPGIAQGDDVAFDPTEESGSGDHRDAYIILKRAFDDLKKKYFVQKDENKRTKTKLAMVQQANKLLKNKSHAAEQNAFDTQFMQEQVNELHLVSREKEDLQGKLYKSFDAFNEKYQECERLQKSLHDVQRTLGERQIQGAAWTEDQASQTDQDEDVSSSRNICPETSIVSSKSIHTQTASEEKIDNAAGSNRENDLKPYGLEIVIQNDKSYLIVTMRETFIDWLNCFFGGKVRVTFDETRVVGRSVQTDSFHTDSERYEELEQRSNDYQAKIIMLKQKVVDQANELKRLYDVLEILSSKAQPDKPEARDEGIQTDREKDEATTEDAVVTRKRLQQLIANITVIVNETKRLQKQLEYQKKHIKRLLEVISRTKEVRLAVKSTLALSHVKRNAGAAQNSSEEKQHDPSGEEKRPEGAMGSDADDTNILEKETDLSVLMSFVPVIKAPLSMPVQETDIRYRTKIARPQDPHYDSSLDVENPESARPNSRSPPNPSSNDDVRNTIPGVLLPPEIHSGIYLLPDETSEQRDQRTMVGEIHGFGPMVAVPRLPASSGESNESDDIVVIQEEPETVGAAASGFSWPDTIMVCPVCQMMFPPNTTQNEVLLHVDGHFIDG